MGIIYFLTILIVVSAASIFRQGLMVADGGLGFREWKPRSGRRGGEWG
jgi:hypothetical protein